MGNTMKKLLVGSAMSLAMVAGASAADLYVKAPPPPEWSWTGFYGGVTLGVRVANNDWTTSNLFPSIPGTIQPVTTGSVDSTAARIGGYGGYNWRIAPAWVLGIEGDFGWADNSKTVTPAPGTAGISQGGCGPFFCTGQPNGTVIESWDGSLRARVGSLITPSTLVFATGGVAWQRITLASTCGPNGLPSQFCLLNESDSASTTLTGWTVGAGAEQRVLGNWLARVDYRYSNFGTFSQQFFPAGFGPGFDDRYTGNVKVRTNIVNVGLAYKF
jgi:outer membrane immunogenic protein